MDLQDHYNKYNHDKDLRNHLESMVNFLLENYDIEELDDSPKVKINFKINPGNNIWAWIDTYEGGNKYDLVLKNRYLNEHEIENLNLENDKGCTVKTGNQRCIRFNIYKSFNIHQPSFDSFLNNHFKKYKIHKEEGKNDCVELESELSNEEDINYWIFQGNPNKFDVIGQLREGKKSWHVTSHINKIKKGDKILIYVTGPERGFYGTAKVTSDVYEVSDGHRCDIELEYLFLENPVLWDTIVDNSILANSYAGSEGSNFRSNKKEYEELVNLFLEKQNKKNKYKYFSVKDIELLDLAFVEYNKFKEENPEAEVYKYQIISKLNDKLSVDKININNLNNIINILKNNNPNSGSFVYWSNIDNLKKYSNKKPEEVVKFIKNLFNKDESISVRIDTFLDGAKNFQNDISLGTPLFAYLMSAFNSEDFTIYKDSSFQNFCKWFDLNVPFNVGDKYEFYINVCQKLKKYFIDNYNFEPSLLDVQDFIFSIAEYKQLKFRIAFKYIYKVIKEYNHIDNFKEKDRVNNLLFDIHEILIEHDKLKNIKFTEGKYISIFQDKKNTYKCWLALYPSYIATHKDASSFILGITKDNLIEFGLLVGSNLPSNYKQDTELEEDVNQITLDLIINKFVEVLDEFVETNSNTQLDDNILSEELEEENKVNLPMINFDKNITVEDLYFPNEQKIIRQIKNALKNGKNIILIGPPGTGKSKLARIICSNYIGKNNFNMVTATSDWSTFETIGGYQPEKNNQLVFKRGIFLDCYKMKESNSPANKWLIIDEINRADIDKAFGPLFSALTGDKITLNYKNENDLNIKIIPQEEGEDIKVNNYEYVIPTDWRLIATMNTFDKTSLYEMSYAFMRRFAFIPVMVPSHITTDLVSKYLSCWGITDKRFVDDTTKLWKIINKYRKVGPAIVEDIYRYLISSNGDYSSAIIMYLFPQLEGLMEENIYSLIDALGQFSETNMVKEFAFDYFRLERPIDET